MSHILSAWTQVFLVSRETWDLNFKCPRLVRVAAMVILGPQRPDVYGCCYHGNENMGIIHQFQVIVVQILPISVQIRLCRVTWKSPLYSTAWMHQHSRSVKLRVYSDLIPESRHGGLCNVISNIYMVLAFPAAIHAGLLALELHFIVIWKR